MNQNRNNRVEKRHMKAQVERVKLGLQGALATYEGRCFLWELLANCGIYQNSFSGNALNTAFTSGKQSVGQELLLQITTDFPSSYIQMMKESLARDEDIKAKLMKDDEDDDAE